MSFQKRLKSLADEHSNGNISEFARFCGLEESSIRQWIKGPSKPSLDKVAAIAVACSRSLDWLVLGVEATDSVIIPKLGFRASAGTGALVLAEDAGTEAVSRNLLRRLGLSERHARVLYASGDSMKPTIADGDPLIVDTNVETFLDGWVCTFTVGDDAFVKRLRRGPGHTIMVSDNPDWPTREEPIPSVEHFRLVGRVRWVGRTL